MATPITASMFHHHDLGADLLLDSGAVFQLVLGAVDCGTVVTCGRVVRDDVSDPEVRPLGW